MALHFCHLTFASVDIYLEWNGCYKGPLVQLFKEDSDTAVYIGPLEIVISRVRSTTNVSTGDQESHPATGGIP
jgi:hypothetical protein